MDNGVKKFTDVLMDRFEAFKNSDPNQKIIVMTVFALIISTLVVLTFWMNKVNYRVLYSDLSLEDAHKIVKVLQEKKVSYKLQDNGTTILVPAESVYQVRLDLAGEGLPKNGVMGFELFDKSDFQSSDFSENIKYIRALQGELAQTIGHLDAVEEARVNLSIPRDKIYLDEDAEPSASVVLKLRNGQSLTDDEIRGIGRLVASSVSGMKFDKVTIMNTEGELLSDFYQNDSYGATNFQTKLKKEIQKQIETKVKTTLDSVLGSGKTVVSAHVDLKSEQKAIQRETYQPVTNNVGVIRSIQTMVEDYDSKKLGAGAGAGANPATTTAAANSETGAPLYKQQSTTTNYEISKVIENETVTPGQIERLTVGIFIDESAKLTPQQISDLKEVVSSVCGIDTQRGDVLTIRTIKFTPDPVTEEKEKGEDWQLLLKKYGPAAIPAFAPLIILVILMMKMKKSKDSSTKDESKAKTDNSPQRQQERGGMVDVSVSDGDNYQSPFTTAGSGSGGGVGIEAEPGGGTSANVNEIQATIREFAKKNPKLVAAVFEKWVTAKE